MFLRWTMDYGAGEWFVTERANHNFKGNEEGVGLLERGGRTKAKSLAAQGSLEVVLVWSRGGEATDAISLRNAVTWSL